LLHSHSIVPRPRKELFLFIKLLAPPYFSRQPYRQKLWLLFSLGNFDRLKIPPIAFNRQDELARPFMAQSHHPAPARLHRFLPLTSA
jgi:hypothetical protein